MKIYILQTEGYDSHSLNYVYRKLQKAMDKMEELIQAENDWINDVNKDDQNPFSLLKLYRLIKVRVMEKGHYRWIWASDSIADIYFIEEWEV